MSDTASALLPAIEVLESDLAELERRVSGLLASINLLRERAGLQPHSTALSSPTSNRSVTAATNAMKLHSDTFTGKKLSSAVRQYLDMRKAAGGDAPATSREIFDALKQGGFVSGAKDDATALVVLRTMLRKSSGMFVKLQNGKFALRAWYPNFKSPKVSPQNGTADADASALIEDVTEGEGIADGSEVSQANDGDTVAS